MNPSPESTALRALIFLALLLLLLFFVGALVSNVEARREISAKVATPTPAFVSPYANVPVYGSSEQKPIIMAERNEPEVRRAVAVNVPTARAVPTPWPREVSVEVGPKRWSTIVNVPPGKRASVQFTLGRIKIERNGVDLGTFFRSSMVDMEKTGPGSYTFDFHPLHAFNRAPKVEYFDHGTRTLRFLSLERTSENVVVEFLE